jgi:enolase
LESGKVRTDVKEKYGDNIPLGDEGGFDIPVEKVEEPLVLLTQAVSQAGFEGRFRFALDVAADSFYNRETKTYHVDEKDITEDELMGVYDNLIATYHLLSIEDPFYEEAFDTFARIRARHPEVTIVGDDLTVTNRTRLERAVSENSVGALIIKPNQIGTLTETLATMEYARTHGVECIVSHRSGETLDDFIADLTVAFSCFGIKAGARGPKEREVKYSRLRTIIV